MSNISLGDTVRIRSTSDTEQRGFAGRTGMVYGTTTPSDTGVQVIGSRSSDSAVAVQLEGEETPIWFDPSLVEFVDHTPGTTITVGSKTMRRNASGEWIRVGRVAPGIFTPRRSQNRT